MGGVLLRDYDSQRVSVDRGLGKIVTLVGYREEIDMFLIKVVGSHYPIAISMHKSSNM